MKYYETSKFPKAVGSVGFYSVIAVCLVAIGAITWFAVSRYNKAQQQDSPTPMISEPQKATSSIDTPVTEPEPPVTSTPSVNSVEAQNSQTQVPYEEPTQTATAFSFPVEGKIIKDFSDTALQYSATYGDMRMHTAMDISAALGSEIKASASGTVTETEDDSLLGKCMTVDYGGGVTVKYCGFDTFAVAEGEKISAGRVLGTVGTIPSECADDSHIHIEVKKDGKSVPPMDIFSAE